MKRLYTTLLLFFVFQVSAFSQNFFSPGAWKHYRHEIQLSVGASNFLGDLGGKDAVGTNFLKDFEITQTRWSMRAAYGYYLSPSFIWRSSFNIAMVSGNDALTKEPFRYNRNLDFQSMVYEFSQNIQFLLLREKVGNRYGLKNSSGKKIGARSTSIGVYLTAGIGVFYYNPKSRFNGQLVNLQPLHTEGQGLPDGPKQYKRVSLSLPLGFGVRKAFGRQWGAYLEFTQHYTFTDYIDDVSGVYYDNNALAAAYGPVSAAMADPNLGLFVNPGGDSYTTAAGLQRGDSGDKDNFMMLTAGAFYKIKTNARNYGRGRRKIKALF